MKYYKVAFLLDKSNDWLKKYVDEYIKTTVHKDRFDFKAIYEINTKNIFHITFILGYTKIIDHKSLDPKGLYLIVHESDLPKGKGFSPIQWQILEGKNCIKITLFEATEQVDSGDIYLQQEIQFSGDELFGEIREKQALATFRLIERFLKDYPSYTKFAQIGEEHFYPKRTIQDDELDINKSIAEQFNHLRIADNDRHPLWFKINDQRYYIKIYKNLNDQ